MTLSEQWAIVMNHIKNPRNLNIREQEAIPFVHDFIKKMIKAGEDDLEELKAGRPMVHKMHMLSKAVSVMKTTAFSDHFVAGGGCQALGLWLRPLPNGTLPNFELRKQLLVCCSRLPITKDALMNWGVSAWCCHQGLIEESSGGYRQQKTGR